MIVTIDSNAGFCWGVVRAIDFAEDELKKNGKIYCLGDIIHNSLEVKRLNSLGLQTVSVDDFENLEPGSKVLIRAHGEPPSTYEKALKHQIEIVDATCPVVTKVQERVRKFADDNYQVVIYGKKNHAEVLGIDGVTGNKSIVIGSVEEGLEKIPFDKDTVLFSQTTMDKTAFKELAETLRDKVSNLVIDSVEDTAVEFHSKDTICGQVSGRDKKLRQFAQSNDVVIFASGKKSSNGKVLYDIAKSENPNSYFVEFIEEIDLAWFEGKNSVGISGATSTPQWLMEEIKQFLETKFNK